MVMFTVGISSNVNIPSSTIKSEITTMVSSSRCQAITKSGHQCKRNAKPGSKYCWQHQK